MKKKLCQKSNKELTIFDRLEKVIEGSHLSPLDILNNFSVYAPRQSIARFLNRYEIFKKILNVHGSIMDFGVYKGSGAFSWMHFSSILEPYNISRKIYGFDTFKGFVGVSNKDSRCYSNGILTDSSYDELVKVSAIHQENIAVSHFKRLEFIKGDICKTMPLFLKKNPHLIVALAYIDVDIYKPTKTILRNIISRMPKGGIIAFDELNNESAQGESIALLEELDINKFRINRNSFDSFPCYAVVE